jgi:hypothetical protein
LWQSFSEPAHASTSLPQTAPAHVDAQVHVNFATPSVHVEPFMHGDDTQSLSFTSQLKPL